MTGREIHHKTDHIRSSADDINDAINLWSDANVCINDAWLAFGALGTIDNEAARIRYEGIRNDAINRLTGSTNSLIETRESLYRVADEYDGVEDKTAERVNHVGLTHRPDI